MKICEMTTHVTKETNLIKLFTETLCYLRMNNIFPCTADIFLHHFHLQNVKELVL